jgi:uncharacterized membrane protein
MNISGYHITWVELVGLLGAILILLGFYRTSVGKWKSNSFWYELDNLVGSLLLLTYHILTKTYVVMILNVLWAVVAFKGITSYAERKAHGRVRKKWR